MTLNHECPYCHQVHMIILGAEEKDEHKLNHLAAMQCDCDEALAYQDNSHMTTYAETAINEFFSEESDDTKIWLISCLPKLASSTVQKMSVTLENGVKATLTRKEGSIGVVRTEIIKKEKK